MKRAIIALVFRCKITGGELATSDEVSAFRWATAAEVTELADEAYTVRVLDALGGDHPAAVRHHDRVHLTET
jgi:8-oxo-dGTP diphosphatase